MGGGTPSVIKCGIETTTLTGQVETSASSQTNEWQFIAMTWISGGDVEVFIDGQLNTPSATLNLPLSGTTVLGTGTTGIYLGTGAKGSATTGWNGNMEDVRFYNRKLSAAEIETMYSTRGNDNIVQGLLFRTLFNELPVGQAATTSSVVDISGLLGDADTVGGTPTYVESPGFASRRSTRNN